ncbi:MAG: hypothetical protein QNI97_12100 [Desulfobacterales bacterium]|nr:hypothetical protein [Desulfobacterales bacterium]
MENEKKEIYDLVHEIVCQNSFGLDCKESEVYNEKGVWKLYLNGILSPWILGAAVNEIETNLHHHRIKFIADIALPISVLIEAIKNYRYPIPI